MVKLINKIAIFISERKAEDSDYIFRNSIKLFILHGLSIALLFLSNYVLIKIAGVSDYGAYVYVFNSINLLVSFCLLGVDTLLIKTISIYNASGDYGKLKGVLFFSITFILSSSVIVGFFSAPVRFLFDDIEQKTPSNNFVFNSFLLLILSLTSLCQATMQGLKNIVPSQTIEKILKPVLLLISVCIFFCLNKVTFTALVWSNVLAISVSCIFGFAILFKQIGSKLNEVKPIYKLNEWSKSALAFFTISFLYVLNSRIDIFFLGFLKDTQSVGVYNILIRVSEIIGLSLVIINFVLTPTLAKLLAEGDVQLLQKIITRSARLVLAIGLPLLISIIFFSNDILIFFGVNFKHASDALIILCCGQFINILCGSVGLLLMMSGNEKFAILSLGLSVVFNLVANITLIPAFGILGAAIATSGTLVIWNLLMYFFVRKRLQIRTTAIEIM